MKNKTLENHRVLIVDDQRAFQLMFKGVLYSMGATNVAFAPTGEQALAKCAGVSYDILFVDYHLGVGKNGKQLLKSCFLQWVAIDQLAQQAFCAVI